MSRLPLVPLGVCCKVVSGATPRTDVAAYWDGDIPWATPKDLTDLDGTYIHDTPRKITDLGLRSCGASILPVDSVLLSSRAPIGYVAINTQPMATNQGFKSLVPIPGKVHAGYLSYWLKANKTYLESLGSGATFKELSKTVVQNIEIPLPPIEIQHLASEMLSQVDSVRRSRHSTAALLDELGQSLFLNMFDPSNYPDDADLGQYLTFVTSGGRGWAKYYTPSGSRFIRSLDVRMNEISDSAAVYVTPPHNAEAKRTRTRAGDVLLTITGSLIGRVAPVPTELEGSYISQHVAILRPDPTSLLPEFLSFYLSLQAGGQREISRLQYGQTKPGLNFEQIRKFRVPVPSIAEQHLFVEKLDRIKDIVHLHRLHLARLDELFASLQSRAFAGEL